MDTCNKDALLHLLRNPYGWSEETVRDARQKAADELERLWAMETQVGFIGRQLAKLGADKTGEV